MWGHKPNIQPGFTEAMGQATTVTNSGKVMLTSPVTPSVPLLYQWIISIGLLVLSMEWIYPVTSSGQAGSERFATVMAGYSAVLLCLGLLRTGWLASILVRIPVILAALCLMYGGAHPIDWALSYPNVLNSDMGKWIENGHFRVMSKESKGLFMLCGWSMLLASVQYLVLLRRSIMLFGGGTLIYLLLLESLVGFEAFGSVVRSVFLLLSLQGILYLIRLHDGTRFERAGLEKAGLKKIPYAEPKMPRSSTKINGIWLIVMFGSVACLIWLAMIPARMNFVTPAERISVMDTVERLAKWAGYTPSGSMPASLNVTGYSTVDAPMGAPLVQGDGLVFTANSPVPTYWRGETRSYYNGSTWSDLDQQFRYANPSGLLRSDGWEEHPYWNRVRQIITMEREWLAPNPIFAGGIPVSLTFQDGNDINEKNGKRLLSSEESGTLWLAGGRDRANSVRNYTVDVMVPDVTPEQLRQAADMNKAADPAAIRRSDLQLPDTLPQRVRDLAAEVVSNSSTRYDAVQAVRAYLKEKTRYTLDTRMPPRGTDFVDDFLFVTRVGYCNHYSTAMIVLLRAEGIPARWVKGYAPGQADPQVPGRYVVTQGNAHSWVEVYFPGVGWMPFEATPGFDAAQAATARAVIAGVQPGDGASLPAGAGSGLDRAGAWLAARAREFVAAPWLAATALAAAALLCAAAWACARWLRPALRLRLLLAWPRSSFPDREQLLRAAAPVWHALARQYGPRPPGMTLREYAASPAVAAGANSADIARFAADWERLLYGPDRPLRADSLDFLRRALHLTRRSARRQR